MDENLKFKNAIKLTVSNGAFTETQTRNPAISIGSPAQVGGGWKVTLRTVVVAQEPGIRLHSNKHKFKQS